MILRLLIIAMLFPLLYVGVQGQTPPDPITLNKKDQADAALVLKALGKGWDLVDDSPDIDFLIFVSEDRDELNFYPKKSLISRMEQTGLIENMNPKGSVREPSVHYESDGSGWKEITTAGVIVFQYGITPKGKRFLRDAPRLIGKPVRPLRLAKSPVDISPKPIKVVTWDKHAIQKLVDDFERDARSQIAGLFPVSDVADLNSELYSRLVCGPKLWKAIKARAELNGLRPRGSLISVTSDLLSNKSETRILADVPLSSASELTLFVKTLRDVFEITDTPFIRRAETKETPAFVNERGAMNSNETSPNLVGLVLTFIAEAKTSKFLIVADGVPTDELTRAVPRVSWIELVDK